MVWATFNGSDYAEAKVKQWDYGQKLVIQGLKIPTSVEVHFAVCGSSDPAKVRVGTTADGITTAPIPDGVLEQPKDIMAYIYITDENSGKTEYTIRIKNSPRAKPEIQNKPEEAELFREAIAAVNAAADRAEAAISADHISYIVNEYLKEHPIQGGATQEQAEQIKKNKEDIGELKDDLSQLSEEMKNLDVRSIADIQKTASELLVDTYTITYTDGTSSTFKVTNGSSDEAYIESVIRAWLDDHPEATTTVQDGVITEAKLADDVKNKLGTSNDYKWIAKGQMREPVRDFQGWAHGVQFDEELGVAVCMIISGEGSHSNKPPYYRATINPATGYMSEYEEVKMYDQDGNELSDCGYFASFNILSDGTYILSDYYRRFFTSTDKGHTWNYSHTVTMENEADNCQLWGITELSNGRWLASNGGHDNSYGGTFYSDDKGKTWTRVKTTTVTGAADAGWSFPEGVTPFEAVFIEIGNGKVVQYARATNNGRNSSGTARANQEPALFSKSDDYGTTWTTFVCSASITDMSCCNGKVVIKDGYVHFLYGSRRLGITDPEGNVRNGCMYYSKTTLENAYLDVWETPVIVDYDHWDADTAASVTDIGYPSLWLDNLGNLNGVYYDSAESTGDNAAYCANWRYLWGCPYPAQTLVSDKAVASKNLTYSQFDIDIIIAALNEKFEKSIANVKADYTNKINKIIIENGGTVEDSGDNDGTSVIYSGLKAWYDCSDESNYDTENCLLKPYIGDFNLKYSASVTTPIVVNGCIVLSDKSLATTVDANGTVSKIDISEGFSGVSIEGVMYKVVTNPLWACFAPSGFNNTVALNETRIAYPTSTSTITVNSAASAISNGAHHIVWTISEDIACIYRDGALGASITPADVELDTFDLTGYKSGSALGLSGMNSYVEMCRLYNRALSAEEVLNNYTYELAHSALLNS